MEPIVYSHSPILSDLENEMCPIKTHPTIVGVILICENDYSV